MRWIEVAVATTSDEIETVCAELERLGIEGLCIEDERDFQRFLALNRACWDYVDESLSARFAGLSRVKFYLPEDAAGRARVESLRAALGRELSLASVDDADWENGWRRYFAPIPVGKKLLIVPEWENPDADGRSVVRIEPGIGFGTGSHETTRLCLTAMDEMDISGKRVLDLGCGSGILAIAALSLGCASAVGCDIDPKARDAALENAARNGFTAERFTALAGDVLADGRLRQKLGTRFDLVLSNIVADVIIPLAAKVRGFLAPGAVWISSGVIDSRAAEVEAAIRANGFAVERHLREGEWHAFVSR